MSVKQVVPSNDGHAVGVLPSFFSWNEVDRSNPEVSVGTGEQRLESEGIVPPRFIAVVSPINGLEEAKGRLVRAALLPISLRSNQSGGGYVSGSEALKGMVAAPGSRMLV
jgi:hypothetical protein